MIEVEKKISLRNGDAKKIIEGARFIHEQRIRDVYFDNANHDLMKKDMWLRDRNGRFEMKIPMHNKGHLNREVDSYEELDDEADIVAKLGLPHAKSFRIALEEAGYKAIVPYVTTRRTYVLDDFTIVLDHADFGFKIAEVEILVEKEDEMEEASKQIINFAKERDLVTGAVYGKLPTYMREFLPELFEELKQEGVF